MSLSEAIEKDLREWQGDNWQSFNEKVEVQVKEYKQSDIWDMLQCRPHSWTTYERLAAKAHESNKAHFLILKQARIRPVALTNADITRKIESKCSIQAKGYLQSRKKEYVSCFQLEEFYKVNPYLFLEAITAENTQAPTNTLHKTMDEIAAEVFA